MAVSHGRKISNTFVWIILGVLVISLTGFGVRQLGNSGAASVGSVGDEKITVNDYSRALTNRLRQLSQQAKTNITMEQARALGIDRAVLGQVLVTAALDNEANRIGLSIGDTQVQKTLLANRAFQGLNGKFDQAAYKDALRRANLTPAQYDVIVRKDAARTLLQIAISGGVKANDTFALTLYSYVGETRDVTWAPIDESLLAEPTRAPTATEIDAQYKANPKAYTSLETRKITYAVVTPESLYDKITVDDKTLKDLYESQPTKYHVPARRIIDRLVYPTEADAQAARASLTDKSKTFEQLVIARNLTLDDIDMGEVTVNDLDAAAAKAVFALQEPGVVGPIESSLGPALFRVNAVLDQQDTTFEQAKSDLHDEYVADAARRQIADSVVHIDDLLAGGARLEDLVGETDMTLGTMDVTAQTEDGMAAHEEFRAAAAAALKDDLPKAVELEDGSVFALRLDAIVAPALMPLDQVKDKVIADWQAAETRTRLLALAEISKSELETGKTFGEIALTAKTESAAQRQTVVNGPPADLISVAFELADRGVAIVSDATGVAVVQVATIHLFDENAADGKAAVARLTAQLSGQIGNDIYAAFANAVENEAGVIINQTAINAVNAQIR